MELVNSFFKDSPTSSFPAKLGFLVGTIIKWLGIFIFALLLIGVGQFVQFNKSHIDFRTSEINSWAGANQERKELAERFTNTCLVGDKSKKAELPLKPAITIKDCAEPIGASELASFIESKNQILHSIAWPLSLIDGETK